MRDDLLCSCPGQTRRYVQCESQATQEDGLCDGCRARDCPNTPLSWYLDQMDKLIDSEDYSPEVMEPIRDEYMRRCAEKGEQP